MVPGTLKSNKYSQPYKRLDLGNESPVSSGVQVPVGSPDEVGNEEGHDTAQPDDETSPVPVPGPQEQGHVEH